MMSQPPPPPLLPKPGQQVQGGTSTSCGTLDQLSVIRSLLLRHAGDIDIENTNQYSYYHHTQPIIQSGPTCGLAAAVIAAQIVSSADQETLTVPDLFEIALQNSYTISGEMFSAENLSTLCKETMKCCAEVYHKGMEDRSALINHLAQGGVILIPYDCDKNFSPAVLKGHQAHWCLATGFLLTFPQDTIIEGFTVSTRKDPDIETLYHIPHNFILHETDFSRCLQVFLFCRQTKSKHVSLWSYDDLKESNQNLVELSPKIERDIQKYVVPKEGLTSLRGKIIFLKKKE